MCLVFATFSFAITSVVSYNAFMEYKYVFKTLAFTTDSNGIYIDSGNTQTNDNFSETELQIEDTSTVKYNFSDCNNELSRYNTTTIKSNKGDYVSAAILPNQINLNNISLEFKDRSNEIEISITSDKDEEIYIIPVSTPIINNEFSAYKTKENRIDLKPNAPNKYSFKYKTNQLLFLTANNKSPFLKITLTNLKYSCGTTLSQIITFVLLLVAAVLLIATVFSFVIWICMDKKRSGNFMLVVKALMTLAIPLISIITNDYGLSDLFDFILSVWDFG